MHRKETISKVKRRPSEWEKITAHRTTDKQSENGSEVTQSGLTLCDSMDCSQPVSSIYGTYQAKILEWVAISFSRRSSRPKDWTQVYRIVGRQFTIWATRGINNSPNMQAPHAAQYRKNTHPNKKVGKRTTQTFLQRRFTDG